MKFGGVLWCVRMVEGLVNILELSIFRIKENLFVIQLNFLKKYRVAFFKVKLLSF